MIRYDVSRIPSTHPLGDHPSSAPGRTATGARSRGEGTPGPRTSAPASVLSARLEPLRQPVAQDSLDRAVADAGNPRAVEPATGRRRRTLHIRAPRGPPDPATGTPTRHTAAGGPPSATQPRTASSINATRYRSRSTDVDVARTFGRVDALCRYSAASNSSRCRRTASTSAVVAARNPPPSSTSISNSPRLRTIPSASWAGPEPP